MKTHNLVFSTLVIGEDYKKYLDICLMSLSPILRNNNTAVTMIVGCDTDEFTPIQNYDNINIISFRVPRDIPTHNKGFHYFLKLYCIEKAMQYSQRIIHIDCDVIFKDRFYNVLNILEMHDDQGICYRNLIGNRCLLVNKLGCDQKFNKVQEFFGFEANSTITPKLMSEAFIFFNLEQAKLSCFLEQWKSLVPFLTENGLLYDGECKDIYFAAKKCDIPINPLIPVVGKDIIDSVIYLHKPLIKNLERFSIKHSIPVSAVYDYIITTYR